MGQTFSSSSGPHVTKVAVLGATGQQGGAIVDALLAQGENGPHVVALTRNPNSDQAQRLHQKGASLRQCDLNNVDSLIAAFEGCDGAFVVANFWDGMNVEVETQQYYNAAQALKATSTMKHVVYSTLEDSVVEGVTTGGDYKTLHEHPTMGKMFVPHFDGKARAEQYFEGLPVTFLYTSCYVENFTSFFPIVGNKDGTYSFTLPLGKEQQIPWTILPDLGTLVAGIFANKDHIGQKVGQASFYATGDELADILSQASGKTISYNCLPWQTYASFDFPGAVELAQMFELWLRTYDDFCARRQIAPQEEIMLGEPGMTDPVEYVTTMTDRLLIQEYVEEESKQPDKETAPPAKPTKTGSFQKVKSWLSRGKRKNSEKQPVGLG